MKKVVIISVFVGIAGLLAVLLFTVILPNMQYEEVRSMQINNIDLESVSDGTYQGEYTYSKTVYQVNVKISDHKIVNVKIVSGGSGEYAKSAAEGVIDNIIRKQRINVDVVSGATTSSKAIQKAVENALSGAA